MAADERTPKPTEPTQAFAKPISITIEIGDDRTGAAEFLRACAHLLERGDVRKLTIIAE